MATGGCAQRAGVGLDALVVVVVGVASGRPRRMLCGCVNANIVVLVLIRLAAS